MDIEELRQIISCAGTKIRSEPSIYSGCLESAHLLGLVLDKLNVPYKRGFGTVELSKDERVHHCWIEVGDVVLETNPSQVLALPVGAVAIDKGQWQKLTNAKEEEDIFPQRFESLTPEGKKFYDKEAESVIMCSQIDVRP